MAMQYLFFLPFGLGRTSVAGRANAATIEGVKHRKAWLASVFGVVAGIASRKRSGSSITASLLGGGSAEPSRNWWYDSSNDGGRLRANVRTTAAALAVLALGATRDGA